MTEDDVKWLHDLPLHKACGGFTLVHSTLDMPGRWGYVFDTLAAEANFSYQMTALCFHGHTHVPMIYEKQQEITRIEPCKTKITFGKKYFINVGSVGQPRDGDPRACYVLIEDDLVRFCRVEYPIEETVQRIHAIPELDNFLGDRLREGR